MSNRTDVIDLRNRFHIDDNFWNALTNYKYDIVVSIKLLNNEYWSICNNLFSSLVLINNDRKIKNTYPFHLFDNNLNTHLNYMSFNENNFLIPFKYIIKFSNSCNYDFDILDLLTNKPVNLVNLNKSIAVQVFLPEHNMYYVQLKLQTLYNLKIKKKISNDKIFNKFLADNKLTKNIDIIIDFFNSSSFFFISF